MNRLTAKQIAVALNKIRSNARDLLEDAKILIEHGRFARAYTLTQIAREEMAKIPILVSAKVDVQAGVKRDWKLIGKRLNDHKRKIMQLLVFEESIGLVRINSKKEGEEFIQNLNQMKNLSLYVDIQNGKSTSPNEIITEELSESFFSRTNEIFKKFFDNPMVANYEDYGTNFSYQRLESELGKEIASVLKSRDFSKLTREQLLAFHEHTNQATRDFWEKEEVITETLKELLRVLNERDFEGKDILIKELSSFISV